MRRVDRAVVMGALAVVAAGLVAASLFVGPAGLMPGRTIMMELRLPRALLAFVVGAALAGSGTVFQGLFRNPLADPFVLGVSGGAALGAVAAMVTGLQMSVLGLGGVTVAAFVGALGAAWLVWRLARVGGRVPVTTLLLAGFAVSAFASALVSIL
ncbi:MAG: iron chelate uptake ABC transporter family permease subunit, partial [Planctomycetes bacterium]|nr:iron chelate uptake ABC transporter family permease subunit [Planctomycetota bacterium]